MAGDPKIRISASDDTHRAFASVKQGLNGLQSQVKAADASMSAFTGGFAAIGRIAGPLAALAAAGSFAAQMRKTIDYMGGLSDAAVSAGVSVETLSSLLNTLKPTGVGMDDLVDLASKLTKSMQDAGTATSEQASAFKILGVQTHDANGKLRDTGTVLDETAKALAQYADDGNKGAVVQALLGRGAAKYLPVLKDIATLSRQAATVTTEQAQAADDLSDAIGSLNVQMDHLRVNTLGPLVPVLSGLIEQFNAGISAAGGFGNAIMRYGVRYGPGDPAEQLTKLRARRKELQDEIASSALPSMRSFMSGALTTDDRKEELAQLQRDIGYFQLLERQAVGIHGGVLDARDALAMRGTKPSVTPPRSGTGGKGGKKGKDDKPEDFAARIDDMAARLVTGAPIAKARELEAVLERINSMTGLDKEFAGSAVGEVFKGMAAAGVDATTLLERLDKQFFELGLSAEVYDAIQTAIFKTTAEAGGDGAKGLEDLAEKWRGLVDPTHKYLLELQEVQKLIDAGPQYEALARQALASIGKRSADELAGATAQTDGLKDAAKDLGLTFTSAAEDALVEWKGVRDLLGGIEADVMRIMTRQMVTKPLAGALTGLAENLLGNMMGGIRFGPAAPISVSSPTFVRSAGGNVMTEFGPLPLRKHARGGVGYSPMVSVFAEGAIPEAYVPLPDGRTIPVTVAGGGGDTNFYIATPDAESFRRSEGQIKARLSGWSSGAGRFR